MIRLPFPNGWCAVAVCGVAALLAAGCGRPPAKPANDVPVTPKQSEKVERESVAVTVYNQNFGVVRDVRRLRLGQGRVELSFRDVSARIQPETVGIRGLDGAEGLRVLEQNYRYDLLTPQKLLEKYVGKRITVYRYNEATGQDERKEADVLGVEGGVVLRIDGQVTSGFDGRFAFPALPENLVEKPTLVWLLDSDVAEQRVEVTYLTHDLNWRADYVLNLDASDRIADVTGWVTLENRSGTSYENANLRLVAGDVQRLVPAPPPAPPMPEEARDMAAGSAAPQFTQESLFEYHLYALSRPTSILDRETKQVSLLEAHDVPVTKKLVFAGGAYYYRGYYGQVASNQKVSAFLEIENDEAHHLGIPLPKGTLRVYKADQSGARQFVGEDAIEHTPRDEKLRVKLGESFDVVGDRKQTAFSQVSNCVVETAFDIELRNHKDTAEQVEINEPVQGDYEILSSTHPSEKVDASTFRFDVAVPARGKTRVSYRLRLRYC